MTRDEAISGFIDRIRIAEPGIRRAHGHENPITAALWKLDYDMDEAAKSLDAKPTNVIGSNP